MINLKENLTGNKQMRVWWDTTDDFCFQTEPAKLRHRLSLHLLLDLYLRKKDQFSTRASKDKISTCFIYQEWSVIAIKNKFTFDFFLLQYWPYRYRTKTEYSLNAKDVKASLILNQYKKCNQEHIREKHFLKLEYDKCDLLMTKVKNFVTQKVAERPVL